MNKRELLFFFLSLFLIAIAIGVYGLYGNQHTVAQHETQTWKEDDTNKKLHRAEQTLQNLEKELTEANLEAAKSAIDQLAIGSKRKAFEDRLMPLEAELAKQKLAKETVAKLEEAPSMDSLNIAQEAVNKVTSETVKQELQNRIDTISAGLSAPATPIAEPTDPTPQAAVVNNAPAVITPEAPTTNDISSGTAENGTEAP